jgi:hypothetical protein
MIKKIKFRRLILAINIGIVLLLIIIIIKNLKYSKKKIEYEQKIANLQQAGINFSENIENEDKEIKTYYVSADGISNDGTDINNPMSLNEANKKTYYGNEKVLFKRGDVFYGVINFNVEATEEKMFYIGTYGEGEEKPIISGANILVNSNAWLYDEENLYKIDLSNYSNFYGIGRTYWEPYNIGFLEDENGNIYGKRKKSKELLEDENDFYCENNYLYIKSIINPSQKFGRIKFVSRNNLVRISSNTIITGLNIQDTGAHGIVKKGNELKNVYIYNCIIQNIGGSVQTASTFTRYGNGIEFWNQAENTLVEKCIIKNIYDGAYTVQGNTTLTGFQNNVCRNNIFINCTYDIELFAYNKTDTSLKAKMKNQLIENCISINQGKGWGYTVRPDKKAQSMLMIWEKNSIPKDADITLQNNKYINSRCLFYARSSINNVYYSNIINSNNNNIYLNKETTLFAGNGNYQDRSILKEYNQDQNSIFKLLTDAQVQQISNPEILNSNDYNEIKTYYEELEKEFEYTELKQETIEKYNNFLVSNETLLSKINNTTNNINSIIGRIEDMTLDTTNEASLKEIINIVYSVESNIIGANVNKNITTTEMIKLINELNELAQNMDIIYSKVEISNLYDKNEITENIQESQNYINSNKDLEIDNLVELSKIGNEISNKEKTTYADYLYAITLSNWTDNVLNTKIKKYISQNPVTIEYSETNITNKSVKATIKTNAEIQITNNSNSKEYVFDQNGSFTFEYTIKGQAKQITAKVTNIDKTSPIINGVIDGKLYTSKITPTITDENLDAIKLILNGEEVKNFKSGTTLTDEGFYTLTAIDKAGNKTQISFQIMESNNQNYIIQDNIIKNISEQTKKSDFDNKLKLEITYKIARNDEEINEKDNIATGDILTTSAGDKYTLIVTGDLNKDGKLNLKDLVKMRKYLLDGNNLDENEMLSADCNFDGKINLKDLVKIRLMLLNQDATK